VKDTELNEILKRSTVPEREAGYWERFPSGVIAELARRRQNALVAKQDALARALAESGLRRPWALMFPLLGIRPAFAAGLAAVCLALGFFLGFRKGHGSPGNELQLAEVRKYFHEIAALFPNQLQAIVFDQQGAHLVLAGEPNLPASPPLYLKICGPQGCQSFVTFSGQQIRVNGDVCDVLADGRGGVLVVGKSRVWSGSGSAGAVAGYRVKAIPLEGNS
jgi:hypothetical protein